MHLIESLETRRFLAADLAVSFKKTAVPTSVLAGVASKPLITQVNLANTGDALTPADADVVVTIALRNAQNVDTTLGTTTVKAKTLKSTAKTLPIKTPIPASLAAGDYTLVAIVSGGGDVTPGNNTTLGQAVSASAANANLTITAASTLSGTVAAGTSGKLTATITNAGNVPSKAFGKLEVLSTVGATTTVLATVAKVPLNLQPGKSFSVKNVAFKASNTDANSATATISARVTPLTAVIGDDASDNTAVASTLTVSPPPPSPFTARNATVRVAGTITFNVTSKVGRGAIAIQSGNFVDANGVTGTFIFNGANNGMLITPAGAAGFTGTFSSNISLAGKTLTFSESPLGTNTTFAALGVTYNYKVGK